MLEKSVHIRSYWRLVLFLRFFFIFAHRKHFDRSTYTHWQRHLADGNEWMTGDEGIIEHQTIELIPQRPHHPAEAVDRWVHPRKSKHSAGNALVRSVLLLQTTHYLHRQLAMQSNAIIS